MPILTVYARKEPTTDSATQSMVKSHPELQNHKTMQDVQIYHDRECQKKFARFPWHYTQSKPTKRNKWITLSGFRFRLIWIN